MVSHLKANITQSTLSKTVQEVRKGSEAWLRQSHGGYALGRRPPFFQAICPPLFQQWRPRPILSPPSLSLSPSPPLCCANSGGICCRYVQTTHQQHRLLLSSLLFPWGNWGQSPSDLHNQSASVGRSDRPCMAPTHNLVLYHQLCMSKLSHESQV